MHGQVAQISQGRIAGAEIVDGDEHTGLRDVLQYAQRTCGILHQRALGDVELERGRRCPRSLEQRAQARRKGHVLQEARREIHRHAHVQTTVPPGSNLRQPARAGASRGRCSSEKETGR
jgi:hypothetical protein